MLYGVFALGAACMLLGFFVIIKGIGASDSETTLKLFGIEFRASKLGPGLVFSILGLILVIVAAESTASAPGLKAPETAAQSQPAPQAQPQAPVQASAQASPPPVAQPPAAAAPQPAPAPVQAAAVQSLTHEQVASLIRDTLNKISQGYCPTENLQSQVMTSCFQSLTQMRIVFATAGPIQSVNFYGASQTQVGEVDQYLVQFANGPMLWNARMGQDGKFALLLTGAS